MLLADFGLARIINDQTIFQTTCGTPGYMVTESNAGSRGINEGRTRQAGRYVVNWCNDIFLVSDIGLACKAFVGY